MQVIFNTAQLERNAFEVLALGENAGTDCGSMAEVINGILSQVARTQCR